MAASRNAEWRERALNVMPFGSSTCSKAARLTPEEPAVIVRGKGCRVWDADGREFIDFRNSLGPVTLGYCFPAVDEAIRRQLECGIIFGHPHPLEIEVAETIREVVPCAEKVRFLKTGGEAMAACIRLARAYTGRDHVVQIGYNGWLNTLASGARVLPSVEQPQPLPGVPSSISALHHTAGWNDEQTVRRLFEEELPGRIAAVVVAAAYARIEDGKTFYPFLRRITDEHGALLIFDEIVTGFRVALAGVQEYFGVIPDMAVFAKGIANGMPLSVYTGRAEAMDVCRPGGAIISSTYGGETLSLAAAQAAIHVYRTEGVIEHIRAQGRRMWGGLNRLFEEYDVPLRMEGLPACPQLTAQSGAPAGMADAFMRAAFRHGVSLYHVSYVNFSHRDADVDEALERLERAVRDVSRES